MQSRTRWPLVREALIPVLLVLCALPLGSCGGGGRRADPALDWRDANLEGSKRARAFPEAWSLASGPSGGGTPGPRAALREAAKNAAWDTANPTELRRTILVTLADDPDPTVAGDARAMARLMLPKEPSRAMVAHLCELCASRRWIEFGPALVRSYARVVPEVADSQRGERVALTALFPDRSVPEYVFEQFLTPGDPGDTGVPDWKGRVRADAWDLLSRLDQDGTFRASVLAGDRGTGSSDPIVLDLRAAASELKAVPLTGEELRWARALRDPGKPDNAAWWKDAASAIAGLSAEQTRGLQLRHAEPVRWAKRHRSAWVAMSRDDLVNEIERRLKDRQHFGRSSEAEKRRLVPEDLRSAREKLRWGDALAILVLDEATRQDAVRAELFTQVDIDRRDTSTEMGGTLEPARAVGGAEDDQFRARLFRPRSSERRGDEEFVASDDMIGASDRALAHYHLHVQQARNSDYAGPSRGDLEYAARSGRSCLVFTSVGESALNVDYYQGDGVVLDLGTIERGR